MILGSSCSLRCMFSIHIVSSSSFLLFPPSFPSFSPPSPPSLLPPLLLFSSFSLFLVLSHSVFLPPFVFCLSPFLLLILSLSCPLFFFPLSPLCSFSPLLAWSSLLIIWVPVKDESDLARTIKSITMIKYSQEF